MREASDVRIGADGETAAMACHPSRVDVPGVRLVHESAFRAPHRQARDLGREAVERAREVAVIPHAYDDEHPRCLELVHSSQPLKWLTRLDGLLPAANVTPAKRDLRQGGGQQHDHRTRWGVE